MPHARLSLTLPDGVWIREVSTDHPDVLFRVLAALTADDDTGIGLVEVRGEDLPAVVADVEAHEGVTAMEVLGADPGRAVVQFETDAPLLLFPARESGVPLEPPVEIRDGVASLEVTASGDRLSRLGDQLRAFGFAFDVEYVHQSVESDPVLTGTQRELVIAAVESGYYDTPRGCTLTELAESVGVAKSTASETLHRAEGEIVKRFVDGLPERVDRGD